MDDELTCLFLLLLVKSLAIQSSEGHCTNEMCEKKSFSFSNVKTNFSLKGHVFETWKFTNWKECLHACFKNCVCLSFNFEDKIKHGICELNDATYTLAPGFLTESTGVSYFEIDRNYGVDLKGATSQPCSVKRSCENYCCLTNPCQNGGTCHEVCDVNKRRFNCTCAPGFAGHRCHVPSLQSCQEVKVFYKVRPNGVYSIVDERNNVFPVYCDFTSETGFTWTLIQSYSLQNKAKFKGKSFFHHDMPINQHAPEWDNYRLSMSGMKFVGNKSTHWRATCNFPTDGVDFRDYIRSSKARNDLLATPASYRCTWYELVNIRGNRCVNCTAYSPYKEQLDYHIDSWSSDGLGCDFDGQPNGGIDNEDNFGFYQTTNPSFRCTSSLASTTQFWVGGP